MIKDDYLDLQSCCSVQPRRRYPAASKATKNLAEEFLILINYDRAKGEAILSQLVIEYPHKSIEWYYETAIYQLVKNKKMISNYSS